MALAKTVGPGEPPGGSLREALRQTSQPAQEQSKHHARGQRSKAPAMGAGLSTSHPFFLASFPAPHLPSWRGPGAGSRT